jgi:hypothetical protein
MKRCSRCQKTKPFEEFHQSKATNDKLQTYCKKCGAIHQKEWYHKNKRKGKSIRLKTMYGITLEEYEIMVADQGGRCLICEKDDRQLYVDHCHETKKVRGLLCNHCNVGIGHLDECVSTLNRAIEYIRKEG